MSESNVRSIDSLQAFHSGLLRLSGDWDKSLQEIRMMVQRAEEYFSQQQPQYWRHQQQLTDRQLTEAKENLSRKRAMTRSGERPAATEAQQRVRKLERRLRQCEAKIRECKKWSIEIHRQCEQILGPLSDVAEHCEVLLPTAARQLQTLIDQLRLYADQASGKSQP